MSAFSTWKRRATLTVDTPDDSNSYVASVTINHKPGMRADFRDIRFADTNGNALTAHRAYYTEFVSAVFYVELPVATTQFQMYYDNGGVPVASGVAGAGDYWIDPDVNNVYAVADIPAGETVEYYAKKEDGYSPDGENTFEFFDDFDDGVINSTIWDTYTDSGTSIDELSGTLRINPADSAGAYLLSKNNFPDKIILTYKRRSDSDSSTAYQFTSLDDGSSGIDAPNRIRGVIKESSGSDGEHLFESVLAGSSEGGGTWYAEDSSVWHTDQIHVYGDTTKYYVDGTEVETISPISPRSNMYARLCGYGDSTPIYYDYVSIRQYADTTTTVTDMGDYYKISITNNEAHDLTGYQVQLDAASLGITSDDESWKFTGSPSTTANVLSSSVNYEYYPVGLFSTSLVKKIMSAGYDLYLVQAQSGIYDSILADSIGSMSSVLVQQTTSAIYDSLIQLHNTAYFDVLIQSLQQSGYDVDVGLTARGVYDVLVQDNITANYSVIAGVLSQIVATHGVHLQDTTQSQYDVATLAATNAVFDLLMQHNVSTQSSIFVLSEILSQQNIDINKTIRGLHDSLVQANVDSNYDVFTTVLKTLLAQYSISDAIRRDIIELLSQINNEIHLTSTIELEEYT